MPELPDLPDLLAPGPTQARIKILTPAAYRLVHMRASGNHYTAGKPAMDPSGTPRPPVLAALEGEKGAVIVE